MGYRSEAPNMLHVVEDCARKYPRAFDDCHRPERGRRAWVFGHIVASVLHYNHDQRWGVNAKRGNLGDPSMDALAYAEPASPAGGVGVFDIVSSAGETDPRKPQPAPAWIDQTQATVDRGTIGGWIKPKKLAEILAEAGEGGDVALPPDSKPTEPPVVPKPPLQPAPLSEVLRVLQEQGQRLAALEQAQQLTNGGMGQLATQVGDLSTAMHRLISDAIRRIFGTLVEENGVQHPGVAEVAADAAVQLLYERNDKPGGALRVKLPDGVNLGGLFGGGRRGLVASDPEAPAPEK